MARNDKYYYSLLPEIFKFLMFYKHLKLLNMFMTISFFALIVWQTVCFFQDINMAEFLKYFPVYICHIYALQANIIQPLSYKIFVKNLETFKDNFYINPNELDLKIKQKLNHDLILQNVSCCFQVISAVGLALSTYFAWRNDEKDLYIISMFLNKVLPKNSLMKNFLRILMFFLTTLAVFPMIATPYYTIYVLTYLKYRIYCLTDYTSKMKQELKKLDETHKDFNKRVKEKLKTLICGHIQLKRHSRYTLDSTELVHLMFLCNSMLVGLYTVFTLVSPAYHLHNRIIAVTTFFGIAYYTCYSGQAYEDTSTELAKAISDLEWYNWNVSNQKMYLFLYRNSCDEIKLSLQQMLFVNNELFKKIFRILYSATNFLYSVNR